MGFFDDIGFGDVLGPIGSVVGGLFGMSSADSAAEASRDIAREANANSALQSKVAFDRSMEAYGKRYQMTMADMRAAGLNPIMAASGGFNVGSAPSAVPAPTFAQSYVPNYASSAKDVGEAFESTSKGILNIAERGKVGAEVEKLNQDVQESIEKVYLMREQANLVSAQEKETYQKVQESLKRMDVMVSEIFKLNQEVRESVSRESLNYSSRALADSNVELNRAKMGELKAMVGKLGQETENLRLESSELKANSELYEQSGETMKYIEKIGRVISLPGLLIYGRGRKGGR